MNTETVAQTMTIEAATAPAAVEKSTADQIHFSAQCVIDRLIKVRHDSEENFLKAVGNIVSIVREHREVMRRFCRDFTEKYHVAAEASHHVMAASQRQEFEQQEEIFAVLETVVALLGIPAELLEPQPRRVN